MLAVTVPAVTLFNVFNSAAVELIVAPPFWRVVAFTVPPVIVPVAVRFWNPLMSLLESTTTALLAATVPAVTLFNVFNSAAVELIATPPFWRAVAFTVPPVIVPAAVRFLNELISLLESTTIALLAATVPAVTLANVFNSAADDVTIEPANLRPFVPSWEAILKSFVPSETVRAPFTVNPVNVPTLVIFVWAAVWIVPVKLPSILATNVPVATVKFPEVVPVAVVVPTLNLSLVSSQPIKALFPVEPLSIIIPASLVEEAAPLFNSIKLSLITVFVVLTVVVVPFTVKLPAIVTSCDAVTFPTNAVVPSVIVNVLVSVFTIVAPLSKVVVPCNLPLIVTVSVFASPNVTLPLRVVAPLAVNVVNAPVDAVFAPTEPVKPLVAVIVPAAVIFLNELISLLESTTTALLAATVPAVTLANVFNSAADDATIVPANLRPFVPSWEAILKSFVPSETVRAPFTVNPVNVPTLVIFVCAAVCNVPVRFVAVRFLNELISLLESTTTALLAVTVPAVTLANVFNSAADDATIVPANLRPFVPSWEAILKSFVPSETVRAPFTVNPVNVPTLVIFVCAAVCNVPVRFVAVRFLNELISLLESTTIALLAVTVPAVTLFNVFNSAAVDVISLPPIWSLVAFTSPPFP